MDHFLWSSVSFVRFALHEQYFSPRQSISWHNLGPSWMALIEKLKEVTVRVFMRTGDVDGCRTIYWICQNNNQPPHPLTQTSCFKRRSHHICFKWAHCLLWRRLGVGTVAVFCSVVDYFLFLAIQVSLRGKLCFAHGSRGPRNSPVLWSCMSHSGPTVLLLCVHLMTTLHSTAFLPWTLIGKGVNIFLIIYLFVFWWCIIHRFFLLSEFGVS